MSHTHTNVEFVESQGRADYTSYFDTCLFLAKVFAKNVPGKPIAKNTIVEICFNRINRNSAVWEIIYTQRVYFFIHVFFDAANDGVGRIRLSDLILKLCTQNKQKR